MDYSSKNKAIASIDVENAYRYILGREPESPDVIRSWLDQGLSYPELRERFIKSAEFINSLSIGKELMAPLTGIFQEDEQPKQAIEYEAESKTMRKLFDHIQMEWAKMGKESPHYSVITEDRFLPENITNSVVTDFYQTGSDTMRYIKTVLARCDQWDRVKNGKCLEFGCGLGRITAQAAKYFATVHAMDISSPHLRGAQEYMNKSGLDNVSFQLLQEPSILDAMGMFDFIFTIIVLQHNPPPVIAYTIEKFFQHLNQGGVCLFQVPTWIEGYQFSIKKYINDPAARGIEMHALPQRVILKIAEENDCVPLEVLPNLLSGATGKINSYTFVFRKRNEKK